MPNNLNAIQLQEVQPLVRLSVRKDWGRASTCKFSALLWYLHTVGLLEFAVETQEVAGGWKTRQTGCENS